MQLDLLIVNAGFACITLLFWFRFFSSFEQKNAKLSEKETLTSLLWLPSGCNYLASFPSSLLNPYFAKLLC